MTSAGPTLGTLNHLHCLRINLVVLTMCANEFDETGLAPIIYCDDKAIFIATDAEHDTPTLQDAGGTELLLDLLG